MRDKGVAVWEEEVIVSKENEYQENDCDEYDDAIERNSRKEEKHRKTKRRKHQETFFFV